MLCLLARSCIGATTLDEYRKYIEKDAALARRFQVRALIPFQSIRQADWARLN
jgi:ATP-dependent Clp protease ATP-binding subunit ClpA